MEIQVLRSGRLLNGLWGILAGQTLMLHPAEWVYEDESSIGDVKLIFSRFADCAIFVFRL